MVMMPTSPPRDQIKPPPPPAPPPKKSRLCCENGCHYYAGCGGCLGSALLKAARDYLESCIALRLVYIARLGPPDDDNPDAEMIDAESRVAGSEASLKSLLGAG